MQLVSEIGIQLGGPLLPPHPNMTRRNFLELNIYSLPTRDLRWVPHSDSRPMNPLGSPASLKLSINMLPIMFRLMLLMMVLPTCRVMPSHPRFVGDPSLVLYLRSS